MSLKDKSNIDIAIISFYFSLTSLSTVGLGDLNPRSDFERSLCGIILIFGVTIFSFILSKFIVIIDKIKQVNEDLECVDDLHRFFGLLKKFNGGKTMN